MDNTAHENAFKQEKQLRGTEGNIVSGIVYGPAESASTTNVALGGITIRIQGQGRGTDSEDVISGSSGDFSSKLLASGKYSISAIDPQGKYYRAPFTITVNHDVPVDIYMAPGGGGKGRKGRHDSMPVIKKQYSGICCKPQKKTTRKHGCASQKHKA